MKKVPFTKHGSRLFPLQRVSYNELNARQKENYNFQKLAAVLADYGFNCLRLSDDWQGADLLACHVDGRRILQIQLKGRLTVDRKYEGKGLFIAFRQNEVWYMYPHDIVLSLVLDAGLVGNTSSWQTRGHYSWSRLSRQLRGFLQPYIIHGQEERE